MNFVVVVTDETLPRLILSLSRSLSVTHTLVTKKYIVYTLESCFLFLSFCVLLLGDGESATYDDTPMHTPLPPHTYT